MGDFKDRAMYAVIDLSAFTKEKKAIELICSDWNEFEIDLNFSLFSQKRIPLPS